MAHARTIYIIYNITKYYTYIYILLYIIHLSLSLWVCLCVCVCASAMQRWHLSSLGTSLQHWRLHRHLCSLTQLTWQCSLMQTQEPQSWRSWPTDSEFWREKHGNTIDIEIVEALLKYIPRICANIVRNIETSPGNQTAVPLSCWFYPGFCQESMRRPRSKDIWYKNKRTQR